MALGEIALLALGIVLSLGELFVWHEGIFWHGKEKRDPRNFRPPF